MLKQYSFQYCRECFTSAQDPDVRIYIPTAFIYAEDPSSLLLTNNKFVLVVLIERLLSQSMQPKCGARSAFSVTQCRGATVMFRNLNPEPAKSFRLSLLSSHNKNGFILTPCSSTSTQPLASRRGQTTNLPSPCSAVASSLVRNTALV